MLGEGGFGCVYKGVLSDGQLVAVKQLKVGASQGEKEFYLIGLLALQKKLS